MHSAAKIQGRHAAEEAVVQSERVPLRSKLLHRQKENEGSTGGAEKERFWLEKESAPKKVKQIKRKRGGCIVVHWGKKREERERRGGGVASERAKEIEQGKVLEKEEKLCQ